MSNFATSFNRSKEVMFTDPDYQKPYGAKLPPLTSFGNLTYLQFIDLVSFLWDKAHPEVHIIPSDSPKSKFDPEKGYIAYSLVNKKPSDNEVKPRQRHEVIKTDEGDFEGVIFSQSFQHLVQFTAIHKDPVMAERIVEAFEDFMLVSAPQIMAAGTEQLIYNRRIDDMTMTRFGDDVAARGVIYFVALQKLIVISPEKLEMIRIDVRTFVDNNSPSLDDVIYVDVTAEE